MIEIPSCHRSHCITRDEDMKCLQRTKSLFLKFLFGISSGCAIERTACDKHTCVIAWLDLFFSPSGNDIIC